MSMDARILGSNRSIISNFIKFSTIKGFKGFKGFKRFKRFKSFNHGQESINRDIWMGL